VTVTSKAIYWTRVSDRKPAGPHAVRRRLRQAGAAELADRELLTLLLGSEAAAEQIVGTAAWSALVQGVPPDWAALGVTPARRARLEAALELGRRWSLHRVAGGGIRIRTPADAAASTADLAGARREHFVGLYLNTRNRLIARETISVGSLNASIVHPREVYEPALRHRAASLVVVHNHPSGETDPSEDDLLITRRLAETGEILGIGLLDHVIVAPGRFTSLRELGKLP
jgi:DNA repair protein RadC